MFIKLKNYEDNVRCAVDIESISYFSEASRDTVHVGLINGEEYRFDISFENLQKIIEDAGYETLN